MVVLLYHISSLDIEAINKVIDMIIRPVYALTRVLLSVL